MRVPPDPAMASEAKNALAKFHISYFGGGPNYIYRLSGADQITYIYIGSRADHITYDMWARNFKKYFKKYFKNTLKIL